MRRNFRNEGRATNGQENVKNVSRVRMDREFKDSIYGCVRNI